MLLLRFILISALLIFIATESFAASGSLSNSINTKSRSVDKEQNELKSSSDDTDTRDDEKTVEDKKTEKNAQKIILEVYKIQGNKILKDMWASIERVNPDPKVRIEIYTSIQKTLEFRKNKLEKSDLSNESKEILIGYIDYMVVNIEKKKKNLE